MINHQITYDEAETAWLETLDYPFDEADEEEESEDEDGLLTNENTQKGEPFQRTPREPAPSMETRDWPNPIPKATPETIRISDYFNTHSAEHPFGDIFHELRRDNLEYQRLDLTFFISRWFPSTKPETWISLACIGASDFAVSSIARYCNVRTRKLLTLYPHGSYFNCLITFDNGLRKNIPIYNLVAVGFWRFPNAPHMTIDHNDRQSKNDNKDNLSWETRHVQHMNQTRSERPKRMVIGLNPTTLDEIKCWSSAYEAGQELGIDYRKIHKACRYYGICENILWKYKEDKIQEGEIFTPIIIPPGLEQYEISTHSRAKMLDGHITSGSPGPDGYPIISLVNGFTKSDKTYKLHILTALNHVHNPDPVRFKFVNHKDKNRGNGNILNLEWIDHAGNMQHTYMTEHANKHGVNLLNRKREIVATYSSMIEASQKNNIDIKLIFNQCRFLKNLDGETFFEYADPINANRLHSGLPVVQLDLLTKEVRFIWSSGSEASYYTGISITSIFDARAGKNEGKACGFSWREPTLFEIPMDPKKIENIEILKNKCIKRGPKQVVEIQIINGKETVTNTYETIIEAERQTGVKTSMITEICKGIGVHDGYYDGKVRRWFLFYEDYERKDPNEPLIKPFKSYREDHLDRPIVVMTLEGEFFSEHMNAQEARISLKELHIPKLCQATIINVALGYNHRIGDFRFTFKDDYVKDPESYVKNPPHSIRNEIHRRLNAKPQPKSGNRIINLIIVPPPPPPPTVVELIDNEITLTSTK